MFFYSEQSSVLIDPYLSNVVLFLKGEGANNGTSFVDSSTNNYSITRYGNPITSTTQTKIGSSSIYLSGGSNLAFTNHYNSADYLNIASAYNVITTGSFTLETWLYKTNTDTGIVCGTYQWNTGNNSGWSLVYGNDNKIYINGSNGIYNSGANIITSTATASLNTWNHIAITRDSSNTIRCFINGQLCGTRLNYSSTLNLDGGTGASSKQFKVGTYISDSWYVFPYKGYIDNLKITRGVARYTSNFTPTTDY